MGRLVLKVAAAMSGLLAVLVSLFWMLFEPNEYSWMSDDLAGSQLPEDPDVVFKLATFLALVIIIQLTAVVLLRLAGWRRLFQVALIAFGLFDIFALARLLMQAAA